MENWQELFGCHGLSLMVLIVNYWVSYSFWVLVEGIKGKTGGINSKDSRCVS